MSDLARFTVSLPADLAAPFEEEIARRGYSSRSEAVRDLIREALVRREWEGESGDIAATVTLVYNHDSPELTDRLTRLQHQYCHVIVCTTHVHLDHENCLETIILRGPAAAVRAAGDRLQSLRGIKHGRFVGTTTGAVLK